MMEDHSYLLKRAIQVFGMQSFIAPSLAIETKRRNADIIESLDALVAEGKIIVIDGNPKSYKVKEQS